MTEHLATVTICGVLYDVVAHTVSITRATWPAWLLTALIGLCGLAVCVVGIALLAVMLFVIGLVDAIREERSRHA